MWYTMCHEGVHVTTYSEKRRRPGVFLRGLYGHRGRRHPTLRGVPNHATQLFLIRCTLGGQLLRFPSDESAGPLYRRRRTSGRVGMLISLGCDDMVMCTAYIIPARQMLVNILPAVLCLALVGHA